VSESERKEAQRKLQSAWQLLHRPLSASCQERSSRVGMYLSLRLYMLRCGLIDDDGKVINE
jgi:hypothetical protein